VTLAGATRLASSAEFPKTQITARDAGPAGAAAVALEQS